MNDDKTVMKAWTRAQSRLGRRQAMPVVLLGLALAATAVGQVWCIASVLASVLVPGEPAVTWALAGLVGLAIVRAVLQMGADILAARAGMKARARLRGGVLDAILRGGPGLLRRHHTGELTALAVDRIEALDGFFARWLPASVLWVAAPLVIGVLAAFVQPGSALIMAICGIAVPFGQALFGIGAAVASRNQFLAMTRLQARFLDRVRGIATIVLSGRTEDETRRLAAAAEELRVRTMKVLRVAFLSSASIDCALVVALVLVALRNGAQLMALHDQGGVPATVMAAHVARGLFVVLLVPEFFAPFRSLALAYQDRAHASGAAAAMRILPDAAAVRAAGQAVCETGQGVSVAFEHVGFTWDPARGATLDDVSFTAPAGQTLVLWGASGSGKSTIIEMLLGFIQPESGRITINGVDMTTIEPETLVAMTSWIGQKPVLFAGTLRENILFARPDATDDQLQAAIRAAAADAFIANLPRGLETLIGEGGFGLSGGQAQRVAIARAFLKDAPLLLLDEPTAHLDPQTEADVFASLRALAAHRTVILASHSAAVEGFGGQRVDLDHGRIVTSGENAS
ncbi:ABC transporter ATP-binding protein CydD [Komagataeibacter diospyri]|uniref:thiol reductant ABC exporter subunit CydD n=1 Tax=Komagataeibacter diospyri TaxID=1932662 RepID=UPI001136F095|nr:thiol reductant ABC exporter subunit CydD [Komagataeibacter diospyri]GCE91825.1 ABC transporter ATP-binding protein CydD [Komagataeibacter diospyri]